MKVLLSAYACEPNKGSEPGVGWHWALEVARLGHEVWVLTRANNRPAIEAERETLRPLPNLRFLYYDLPPWARWWKRGQRGVHLYYLLWQWGAYRLAKRIHARERLDRVHHVTFGGIRQPSFMGRLGIPFLFGPAGGGERAPWRLRYGYGLRGWFLDAIRDMANFLIGVDPLMRATFGQAETIYVKTPASRRVIPRKYWPKVRCSLEIGVTLRPDAAPRLGNYRRSDRFRILYVGRFLYWKGMHLGLNAFARLLEARPEARLTMVGAGPDETRWRALADKLGLGKCITWFSWTAQAELHHLYSRHDILLFPSLHDSSGNVVLEALAHGLPVVCLDLGGPAVVVDATCGRVIATLGAGRSRVIDRLANALIEIAEDRERYRSLSEGALARARQHDWRSKVRHLYDHS